MRALLLGGSKSGKSHLAQELCRELAGGGPMIYWATMEPVDGEDRERIRRHVDDRAGWGFATLERGRELGLALDDVQGATVLFDSVTAALANEMFTACGTDDGAAERLAEDLLAVSRGCLHFVCVCDEIWRDGFTYDGATEDYRRGLAEICRRLAEEFDAVYEVTAGQIHVWKGEGICR